jgi:hypothetical protein
MLSKPQTLITLLAVSSLASQGCYDKGWGDSPGMPPAHRPEHKSLPDNKELDAQAARDSKITEEGTGPT